MYGTRECLFCHKTFTAQRRADVYCSVECGTRHREEPAVESAANGEGDVIPERPAAPRQTLDRLGATDHIAQYLRVSKEEVERMAAAGEIPARRVGDRWVFSVPAINRWLGGATSTADETGPLESAASRLLAEVKEMEKRVQSLAATLPELPQGRMMSESGKIGFDLQELVTLDALEASYIAFVLQRLGQNKTHAAKALGVDPSTLYRKLGQLGWQ